MERSVLHSLSFFNGLEAADLKLIEPYFHAQEYAAGTVVFEQGEAADYLYLVVRGEVVIRYKPDDGAPMIVARVRPGGIFGWSAAVGNGTYTSGAICEMDSEVLRVRGGDLRLICEQHPHAGKIILERLADVIAERKQSHRQLTSFLANGIRQQSSQGGKVSGG
jgi:CRP-like cAMP-binding protein